MARRRTNDIEVGVTGVADFGKARRDAARDLDKIERDAKDAASDIERAFDKIELSPELDTAEIRQALDLAQQLDGMVARFDIDTDLDEIQQAERIARSLRSFQGRVDLSVEGRAELQDALDLADKMDQLRTVKVQVQGQRDLQRAADLAADLDQTRTVRVNVDDSDIKSIDDEMTAAGERGADGIANAMGSIDFGSIGAQGLDQLTSALTAIGPLGAAGATIGALIGDDLLTGLESSLNRQRIDVVRSIKSGLSDDDLAIAGQAAGEAYAAGFGDSLAQVKQDTDRLLATLGDDIPLGATFDDLAKRAQVMADVLGVEVPQAAQLARRAVVQGLADDVADAFDDMTGVVAEFGETGLETLDIYEEFGGNFTRFGIDGGQAVRFVASAFEDGLFPTLDRAGELFEEFTTEITDGTAQRAIEELGIDFRQLQDDMAAGGERGREALKGVVEALQTYGTEADRRRLANEIFKASFEQVTDRAELLDRILVLLTDTTDAYAGATEDATRAMEDNASAFTILQREIEEAGAELGDFIRWATQVAEVDLTAPFDIGTAVRDFLPFIDDTEEAIGDLSRGAGRSFGDLTMSADNTAAALENVTGAAHDLRTELNKLLDFEYDRLLRDIADAGDDLAAAFDSGAASAVGLSGDIDITTESGRQLQSRLERMSGALQDATLAFADQKISADELRAAQQLAAGQFDRVTGAANLTRGQIEALRQKYFELIGIGTISTQALFLWGDAYGALKRYLAVINGVPRVITTVARTVTGAPTRVRRRAKGGPTTGMTLVGEEGPELIDLGSQRGYVHDASTSRHLLTSAATKLAGTSGTGPAARPGPVVIRIESGGTSFDNALVEILRKSIRNRGGDVQAVLG